MKKFNIKELCIIALFAALTAVFAQISVPVPISAVPISFGMVGLYVSAILLPPKCAVMSQMCYLLLGAAGVPVFSGFRGGISTLFGATGGYLLVYPIMAAIVSVALNRYNHSAKNKNAQRGAFITGAVSICAAHTVLYAGGTIWLCLITGVSFIEGLSIGVLPYIPLDIVKIVFCVTAVIPLRKRIGKFTRLNF